MWYSENRPEAKFKSSGAKATMLDMQIQPITTHLEFEIISSVPKTVIYKRNPRGLLNSRMAAHKEGEGDGAMISMQALVEFRGGRGRGQRIGMSGRKEPMATSHTA